MSSYGRTQDGVIAVLEAFGIDSEMTTRHYYARDDIGEKRLTPLCEALAEVAYTTAFQMGENAAIGRIVAAIQEIGKGSQ
jgi:hypothetical protein